MDIPEDVLQEDAEGRYLWLTLNELVPLVNAEGAQPASIQRTLERWCASGALKDFSVRLYPKCHEEQMRQLFLARRIHQLPPRKKGLYLVRREAIPYLHAYPKPGRRKK